MLALMFIPENFDGLWSPVAGKPVLEKQYRQRSDQQSDGCPSDTCHHIDNLRVAVGGPNLSQLRNPALRPKRSPKKN